MQKIIIDNIDDISQQQLFVVKEFEQNNEINVEVYFKSDFLNTNIIRDFVSFLCDKIWVHSAMKFKIILIVDELNNNAIEYGSSANETNKMRIQLKANKDKYTLTLEVEDTGNWAFPKSSSEMMDIEKQKMKIWFNNWTIRWRWLLIIKNIVDKLYFKDSIYWWLIVWIEKEIKLQKNW